MSRKKQFDPEQALDRAMRLFWKKGYEATSIDDLVRHMGINRFSLYSTFGDKRRLFVRVLDRYRDEIVGKVFGIVEQPGASLPEIRRYFDAALRGAGASGMGRVGCLMSNSMVELGLHDRRVEKKLAAHFDRYWRAFRRALANAKRKGEIRRNLDTAATAHFLAVSVQGFTVYSKLCPDRRLLRSYVRTLLAGLH